MSEKSEPNAAAADPTPGWADLWQSFSESSKQIAEAWSSSMAPFMLARLLEHPQGFAAGNEMSEAIEKMAQGPRLADVWDIDRKMALVFGAWIDMRQKLASYNAVAAAPWTEASKRFLEAMSAVTDNGSKPPPEWREAFAKWSEISNEELIRNQRGEGFLQAQKELLQSGLKLRSRQDDVGEAAAAMFGMPGRKDFDEVTRQLTELRREVRALSHRVNTQQRTSRSARPGVGDASVSSESRPNAQ
ncbi:poly(R)-hydroxyalkanoic acid synthase subunit PhaE [Bradyrhizobium sp. LTSPM299]|uniref:poly(R)-hydroxyalkanoic acid synthase subunit PhaE n=1 Tax=Bradyrhizobium sp. LTSPM299 TaxID=1619233 RepID=UPI0005C89CE7|nr:poly(R)-hydroxyalkanoic acid synthase subunit PhaE [Bradyrhizobium sp. LTSPM299]